MIGTTKIKALAAIEKNGVIGIKSLNEMPWRVGEYALKNKTFWNNFDNPTDFRMVDMQSNFVEESSGDNVALYMGKNTWLSLPKKRRPLQGRDNIVISTTLEPDYEGQEVAIINSEKEAFSLFKKYDMVTVMGGVGVYESMYPYIDEFVISHLNKEFEGDVYFPISMEKINQDFSASLKMEHQDKKFMIKNYVRR